MEEAFCRGNAHLSSNFNVDREIDFSRQGRSFHVDDADSFNFLFLLALSNNLY